MSDKIPYVQIRAMYDDLLEQMLFSNEAKSYHGWAKEDFLQFLQDDIVATAEEETYDIAIIAPAILQ